MKVFPVVGGCSTKNKKVGFQFGQQESRFYLGGSFTVFGEDSGTGAGESVSGDFRYNQGYVGCRLCGHKFVYQCANCSSFVCYDGAQHDSIVCPVCLRASAVPATQDDRIVRSAVQKNIEIILAIDTSSSMKEKIGGVSRLEEMQRAAINNFIYKFPHAKIALVSFGGTVKTELDFTDDPHAVESAVNGLVPAGGTTSPLAHIRRTFPSFTDSNSTSYRYIVIFTDGAWAGNGDGHSQSANTLRRCGVTILTIGCAGADLNFLHTIASQGADIVADDQDFSTPFAIAAEKINQA